MAADDVLGADGLHELAWDTCDALLGDGLVASPADARGRGISLAVTREGAPCDLTGARLYLLWRHREARARGCEEMAAVDAAAGRFRVFYPAAMAGAEGTVDAQLMASWGDRSLSTRAFGIRVEKALAGGAASEDGFTLFLEAIKRYEDATDLVGGVTGEAREAASDARKAAEELLRAREAGEFDGRDGRDGRDGVDGAPGRDGVDGKDGAPGRDGVDGQPGRDGVDGKPGRDGKDGVDGSPGRDGASPSARVEQTGEGAILTVIDGSGATTATLRHGRDGVDGTSPSASVAQTGDGAVVTVTDASGTTTALLSNGRDGRDGIDGADGRAGTDGRDGVDGTSPAVSVQQVEGGAEIAVTDASGTTTAMLRHGERGPAGEDGAPGSPGKDGAPGRDGTDGKDGAPGAPGKDGAPGRDGADGVSVTHEWDGTVLTVTSASGTSSADLRGPQGPSGEGAGVPGPPGADGKDGTNGKDGKDGVSATHSWEGSVLTVTSASGSSSADLRGPAGADGRDGEPGKDGAPGRDGTDGKDGEPGAPGKDGTPGRNGADGVSVTHEWDGTVLRVTSASGTSEADLRGPQGPAGGGGSGAGGAIRVIGESISPDNRPTTLPLPHGSLAVGDLVVDAGRNLGRVTEVAQTQMTTDAVTVEFLVELRPRRLGLAEGVNVAPGAVTHVAYRVDGANLLEGDLVLSHNSGCVGRIKRLSVGYADYVEAYIEGVAQLVTLQTLSDSYASRDYAELLMEDAKAYVDERLASIRDLSGVEF